MRKNARVPGPVLFRLLSCFILASVGLPPPAAQPALAHLSSTTETIQLPAVTDARLTQGQPISACGDEAYLAAGYDLLHQPAGAVRSLLKFDLSRLPPDAVISKAELKLFYTGFNGPLLGTFTIGAALVLEPWAENSVHWSSAPAIAPGAPITTTVNHQNTGAWIVFDATGLVQGWIEGQYPNYGIALLGPEEIPAQSAIEFFESSDSYNPLEPSVTLHPPHLEVTYQLPGSASWDEPAISTAAFLPLVLANFPPQLDLHPIDNDGGEGSYMITWSLHPRGADKYELFEWINNQWQVVFTTTSGETSFAVKDKPLGTYSYYLRATGVGWTETSLVRSVTVSDPPNPFAYLVIGVGDYQNMSPVYHPDARLGYDLGYPAFDAADIRDMLEVYGYANGAPFAPVLALVDRQASKAAIQSAITGWLDAHEDKNTTIFIYFAGHTLVQGAQPYLAPYDLACQPCGDTPTWLAASAISAGELKSWLGELASDRLILVLDSPNSERWIGELASNNWTILAGSRIDEPRSEFQDIRNGAFSYFFNQAYIQNADQNGNASLSISEIYDFSAPLNIYVYTQTLGAFTQHPVLAPGALSQVDLLKVVSLQSCQPLK